ncbi:MAG: thioredoxin domain-containing protein [Planctomycetota bacterium]
MFPLRPIVRPARVSLWSVAFVLATAHLLNPPPTSGQEVAPPTAVSQRRLAQEESAYLRMHADNPVDWFPWGDDAFARARELDRPVFLSIGYASCHWCHVMRRESFDDAEVAKYLNDHFVAIKVDREELPHVDDVYMQAVQRMTGSGGWPLSVFLDASGKPFFGGTYFPPRERSGRPGLLELLQQVDQVWRTKRGELTTFGERLTAELAQSNAVQGESTNVAAFLRRGLELTLPNVDPDWGGFRGEPKFPMPRLLQFYAAVAVLDERDDLRIPADTTLLRMAEGGLFDQIGGGFHRYATDEKWRVPHFEKMLYSQGLMAEAYLEAGRLFEDPALFEVARATLNAMLRDFALDGGGFAASWDADSEEAEGTFYVWTPAQVEAALQDQADIIPTVLSYLGIDAAGNFEGNRTVPYRARRVSMISGDLARPPAQVRKEVEAGLARLFDVRQQRVAPARDPKVILGWNALAVSALARGANLLGDRRYADAAMRAHAFADRLLVTKDGFLRRWADGAAEFPATLQDAALHLKACLDLYDATFDASHIARAREVMRAIGRDYGRPAAASTDTASGEALMIGPYYETRAGVDVLLPRRTRFDDDALPSGNATVARCLWRLHGLTGHAPYREDSLRIIQAGMAALEQAPQASPELLLAALQSVAPSPQIAIFGDIQHPLTHALLRPIRHSIMPFFVLAHRPPGEAGAAAARAIPLLAEKTAEGNRPTAFLCEDFVCQAPQSDPEPFAKQFRALIPRPAAQRTNAPTPSPEKVDGD